MKIKANGIRRRSERWGLVLLLLLSGASQIWGQKVPNPGDEKTPREAKTVENKTLKTISRQAAADEDNQKNNDLPRAVKTETTPNYQKQSRPSAPEAEKNRASEITVTENKVTLLVTEDIAEYQSAVPDLPKRRPATNVMLEPAPNSQRKTFRFPVPAISNRISLPAAVVMTPRCEWEKTADALRDPFDAQSKLCNSIYQQNLKGERDPFAKPPAVVFAPAEYPATMPIRNQIYPNGQDSIGSFKRSEAGFNPQWIDWMIAYASAEGVDPLLILEVMRWESSFKPYAVSPVGAGGLMQFMPQTASRFGINPFDERQAISGGSRYIGFLLRRFNGNVLSALAGYNAGEGAVDAFLNCRTIRAGAKTINPLGRCTTNGIPPYAETQKYAAGIWANYQMSLRRAVGINDSRQRIAVNVRFKFINSEAVGLKGQQTAQN